MKLQNKLLVFLLPVVIAPLIVLGSVAYLQLKTFSIDRTLSEIESVLNQAVSRIKHSVEDVESNVDLFSNSQLINEYLLVADDPTRRELLQPGLLSLFESYQRAYPEYIEIQLLLPNGYEDTRSTIGVIDNVTNEEKNSYAYRTVFNSTETIASYVTTNPDDGRSVLMVSEKIYVKDPALAKAELRGYLVLKVDTAFLKSILRVNAPEKIGILSFVDNKGGVIFGEAREDNSIESIRYAIARDEIMRDVVYQREDNQGNVIMAVKALNGLYAIMSVPSSQLLAEGLELRRITVAILVIAMFITSALIMIVLRKFVLNPVKRLNQVTDRFAEGDLDEVVIAPSGDEIGELYSSYELMRRNMNLYQRQLEKGNKDLMLAKQLAEDSNQAKSAFLANMSHEIRTPLAAIIGFSESMLDSKQTPSERDEAIHTIIRSGKHLHNIINDILDMSKIEANMLDIEVLRVSPFDLLDDVKSLEGLVAEEKGLEFKINYAMPIPDYIETDPVRLKQILINLSNNAIKFTKKGSVVINVVYDVENNRMQFSVTDTGIGMSAEQASRVFDAFTQADTSITREFGGTGLGLNLSQQLAAILGGEISVESEVGKGSCFMLSVSAGNTRNSELLYEVPVSRVNKDDAPRPETLSLKGNVLLVEDNHDNQRLISLHIKRVGGKVFIANNGRESVTDATISGKYDLILMDMQMPIMGGLEATESLRKAGCVTPIVMLTANATSDDMENARKAGCNEFVTKPINWDLFFAVLEHYLDIDESVEVSTEAKEESVSNDVTGERESIEEFGVIRSELIDDDPDMAILVNGYIERLPGIVKEIESLMAEDVEEARRKVHDLKGTSGNYGFPELHQAVVELEGRIKANELDAAEKQFVNVKSLCERIIRGGDSPECGAA